MKKLTKRAIALLLFLFIFPCQVSAETLLIPVGQVIGLELRTDTVSIAAIDDTLGRNAAAAGLQVGDQLISIDGAPIRCAQDVSTALQHSDGTVELSVLRAGKTHAFRFTPQITPEGPRLGVYLKQGITGVGTVTWYDPEKGTFGALGHGVNDPQGKLLPMTEGKVYRAGVRTVKKGRSGEPGQLVGALEDLSPIGSIQKNTSQGLFGLTNEVFRGQALPVGSAREVHIGEAAILSTVCGKQPQEYSVEILKIYPHASAEGRNTIGKIKVRTPVCLTVTPSS